MMPGGQTPFYRFYTLVAGAAAPLVWARIRRKLTREGIAPDRQRERLGHATEPRPDGRLWWFHAASVGEGVSVLALIREILAQDPDAQALLTTGTASSAKVLADRMPPRCRHQFAPLDSRGALDRFLNHWRPDAGIFVESELWPQMLVRADARGVPLALVNARMSKTSLKNWAKFDDTARFLLSLFRLIRTQDDATRDGLRALGAEAEKWPNLKSMIPPPPCNAGALAVLRPALPAPLWAAVSTHEGEEAEVLAAHRIARKNLPRLRLLLVPRHPERADAIRAQITDLTIAQRSKAEDPANADIYLADTLGETGLWFTLAPVVFLGGSFGRAGGHTPYEPAQCGAAILHGPRIANFAEAYAEFDSAGAARQVADAPALADAVTALLNDEPARTRMAEAAQAIGRTRKDALAQIAAELIRALSPA